MTCWGSHSGTEEIGELPWFPPPNPHLRAKKGGKRQGTASRSTPGACPVPRQGPLILLGDLEARWRGQLAGGQQGWPRVPDSHPAEPPISAQGLRYPNTTQRLRLPKAPNSRDSGVPAPTSPQDQGAPALHSKNSGIRALFPSVQ